MAESRLLMTADTPMAAKPRRQRPCASMGNGVPDSNWTCTICGYINENDSTVRLNRCTICCYINEVKDVDVSDLPSLPSAVIRQIEVNYGSSFSYAPKTTREDYAKELQSEHAERGVRTGQVEQNEHSAREVFEGQNLAEILAIYQIELKTANQKMIGLENKISGKDALLSRKNERIHIISTDKFHLENELNLLRTERDQWQRDQNQLIVALRDKTQRIFCLENDISDKDGKIEVLSSNTFQMENELNLLRAERTLLEVDQNQLIILSFAVGFGLMIFGVALILMYWIFRFGALRKKNDEEKKLMYEIHRQWPSMPQIKEEPEGQEQDRFEVVFDPRVTFNLRRGDWPPEPFEFFMKNSSAVQGVMMDDIVNEMMGEELGEDNESNEGFAVTE